MTANPAALSFPATSEDAHRRFSQFQDNDPFAEVIAPALLNSADIYDYVRVTGMLWPFCTRPEALTEKLKGASYEIDFLGDVYTCPDDKAALEKRKIEKDSVFILRKNSIAFVYLETTFRLPHYIAMRFNLRITHVHRGLLLGTGPLVDPGFVGRLLIPLHNLTAKDYTLVGGEGLIWAEFTKVSQFVPFDGRIRSSERRLFSIPERKIKYEAQGYFNRASEGVPARSSIPEEVSKAKQIAEETSVKVSRYTWGAIITGALTALALIGATWSLISDANNNVADSARSVAESQRSLDALTREVQALKMEVRSLKAKSDLENRTSRQ